MTCTTHHNACDCRQHAIDANLGRLLLSDLRYSMGKRSTAPHDCAEGVRRLWHMCDKAHRGLLLRELRQRVAMWGGDGYRCPGYLGDSYDAEIWTELLAWMEEQC